jgi:hypothetical protein
MYLANKKIENLRFELSEKSLPVWLIRALAGGHVLQLGQSRGKARLFR